MSLTLSAAVVLLKSHDLLVEVINRREVEFQDIAYDSRKVHEPGTLFFCKGANFDVTYLQKAILSGAVAYVAKEDLHQLTVGLIVRDEQKAMALLSAPSTTSRKMTSLWLGLPGPRGRRPLPTLPLTPWRPAPTRRWP